MGRLAHLEAGLSGLGADERRRGPPEARCAPAAQRLSSSTLPADSVACGQVAASAPIESLDFMADAEAAAREQAAQAAATRKAKQAEKEQAKKDRQKEEAKQRAAAKAQARQAAKARAAEDQQRQAKEAERDRKEEIKFQKQREAAREGVGGDRRAVQRTATPVH